MRKKYITATEMGGLLGVNPYITPSRLLKDKLKEPVKIVSDYLDRGKEHEGAVLAVAAEWLNGSLEECHGFYANSKTRISATPDGMLEDGRLIEVKCTGMRNLPNWEKHPPLYYVAQAQVQMYVTGARENYIMARFFYNWPNKDCEPVADRMYKISYSDEIMQICIDRVEKFWYALDNNETIRLKSEENEQNKEILRKTCEPIRENIIMEKIEIPAKQLSIIRQTCFKAATKLYPGDSVDKIVQLATKIEEKIFIELATKANTTTQEFLIQIGACVNGYVEGQVDTQISTIVEDDESFEIVADRTKIIPHMKNYVLHGLKYILRP
jgi:putative phage-type endonuclease